MSRPKLTETRRRALMLIYLTDDDNFDADIISKKMHKLGTTFDFEKQPQIFHSLNLQTPITLQNGMVIPNIITADTYYALRRGYITEKRPGALLAISAYRNIALRLTKMGRHRLRCRPEFQELRALKCLRLF